MNGEPNFDNLREKLNNEYSWPSTYLFKFIYLSDNEKTDEILSFFDLKEDSFEIKSSSKGKYSSLNITKNINHVEEIIEIYMEVGKIQGVMAL